MVIKSFHLLTIYRINSIICPSGIAFYEEGSLVSAIIVVNKP